MKDFRVLRFLDRISGIFGRFGIDYTVLRKILQIKLIMDSRRVPTVMSNRKRNDEEGKSSFRSALWIYGLIGLFVAAFIFFPFPLFFKMNLSIGMIIFMVMTTMISDFSAVLLDVREKNILLPRPIDPRTMNAAKVIHIIIYLFGITAAIAGPSLIAGLIKYGIVFALMFIVEVILICGLVIFLTSMLYSLILVFFDGEKLKDMINYFQIILSVFIAVFYQLIGRIFDISSMNLNIEPAWWQYLLPSTWFAAPYSIIYEHVYSGFYVSLSIMAVLIPAITLLLYVKLVVPYFERNLQKLNDNSTRQKSSHEAREKRQRRLSALICADNSERLFFRFTQSMVKNERKLKLKLYPSLALSAVLPFLLMSSSFRGAKSFKDILASIQGGSYYLGLYFAAVMLASSVPMLSRSERYKGAWIYRVLPFDSPVPILKGAFKGFLVKFVIPLFTVISLLFLVIYGIRIIPDIILIFINLLIMMLFFFMRSKKELPFYRDFQLTQDGSTTALVFLSFLLAAVFGAIHYAASTIAFGITVNIVVSLVIAALLWHFCFKITWKDVINDAA